MEQIRRLLLSRKNKGIAIAIVVLLVGYAIYSVAGSMRENSEPSSSHYTMFICTETGKTFRHKNELGDQLPLQSPYSGKRTGIPAEACYWTTDGGTKEEPTWVLVKQFVGEKGPTFCPDCGRLVVGHNPPPGPGVRPPPTEAEYAARLAAHRASRSRNDER